MSFTPNSQPESQEPHNLSNLALEPELSAINLKDGASDKPQKVSALNYACLPGLPLELRGEIYNLVLRDTYKDLSEDKKNDYTRPRTFEVFECFSNYVRAAWEYSDSIEGSLVLLGLNDQLREFGGVTRTERYVNPPLATKHPLALVNHEARQYTKEFFEKKVFVLLRNLFADLGRAPQLRLRINGLPTAVQRLSRSEEFFCPARDTICLWADLEKSPGPARMGRLERLGMTANNALVSFLGTKDPELFHCIEDLEVCGAYHDFYAKRESETADQQVWDEMVFKYFPRLRRVTIRPTGHLKKDSPHAHMSDEDWTSALELMKDFFLRNIARNEGYRLPAIRVVLGGPCPMG